MFFDIVNLLNIVPENSDIARDLKNLIGALKSSDFKSEDNPSFSEVLKTFMNSVFNEEKEQNLEKKAIKKEIKLDFALNVPEEKVDGFSEDGEKDLVNIEHRLDGGTSKEEEKGKKIKLSDNEMESALSDVEILVDDVLQDEAVDKRDISYLVSDVDNEGKGKAKDVIKKDKKTKDKGGHDPVRLELVDDKVVFIKTEGVLKEGGDRKDLVDSGDNLDGAFDSDDKEITVGEFGVRDVKDDLDSVVEKQGIFDESKKEKGDSSFINLGVDVEIEGDSESITVETKGIYARVEERGVDKKEIKTEGVLKEGGDRENLVDSGDNLDGAFDSDDKEITGLIREIVKGFDKKANNNRTKVSDAKANKDLDIIHNKHKDHKLEKGQSKKHHDEVLAKLDMDTGEKIKNSDIDIDNNVGNYSEKKFSSEADFKILKSDHTVKSVKSSISGEHGSSGSNYNHHSEPFLGTGDLINEGISDNRDLNFDKKEVFSKVKKSILESLGHDTKDVRIKFIEHRDGVGRAHIVVDVEGKEKIKVITEGHDKVRIIFDSSENKHGIINSLGKLDLGDLKSNLERQGFSHVFFEFSSGNNGSFSFSGYNTKRQKFYTSSTNPSIQETPHTNLVSSLSDSLNLIV